MGSLQDNFNALLAKLDLDAGVTDVDYKSSLEVDIEDTIELPNDIVLPIPQSKEEAELHMVLTDYFTQLRQTLIEIESKLP